MDNSFKQSEMWFYGGCVYNYLMYLVKYTFFSNFASVCYSKSYSYIYIHTYTLGGFSVPSKVRALLENLLLVILNLPVPPVIMKLLFYTTNFLTSILIHFYVYIYIPIYQIKNTFPFSIRQFYCFIFVSR